MKLVILNGPSGVGKTSVAKKLHKIIPLSLYVNVDDERKKISGYKDSPQEVTKLAFNFSLSIVDSYLKTGHDVIFDRMMWTGYATYEELLDIGKKQKADIIEIILFANKETILDRVKNRGYDPNGLLTPEKVERFWEECQNLKKERSNAIFIDTEDLSEEQVFELIKREVI